jgi:hypothetical protein
MNANHRESTQIEAPSLALFAAFCGDWRSFAAFHLEQAVFVSSPTSGDQNLNQNRAKVNKDVRVLEKTRVWHHIRL